MDTWYAGPEGKTCGSCLRKVQVTESTVFQRTMVSSRDVRETTNSKMEKLFRKFSIVNRLNDR